MSIVEAPTDRAASPVLRTGRASDVDDIDSYRRSPTARVEARWDPNRTGLD